MRKLCFFAAVFALAPWASQAAIIINEVGAFESADNEWVELFNTGNEAVDLTGWKFFENTVNHGLTAFQGDFLLGAGEYAVIANKADIFVQAKSYAGTVLDSSWSSLNEAGEEIGLNTASGEVSERFTYIAAPDFSLERKDPNVLDYSSNNWQQHVSGHTAGFQNSNSVGTPDETPEPTPEEGNDEEDNTPPADETPSDEDTTDPEEGDTPSDEDDQDDSDSSPEEDESDGDESDSEDPSDPNDGDNGNHSHNIHEKLIQKIQLIRQRIEVFRQNLREKLILEIGFPF